MALVTNYPVLSAHEHEVKLPLRIYSENVAKILEWLDDNFGNYYDNNEWDIYEIDVTNIAYFTFRYEHQAMAFKLAWME